jgi:hypothetical protein
MLTRLGVEQERDAPAPVTLPKLALRPLDNDENEIAARFAEQRTIRAGIDAWTAITKAESFESWKAIGRALQVGRDYAMRATGANRPMGRNYSRAFSEWINQHHFDRMPKSTRSMALELNENISAIEQWRATLTDKQRQRCIHPLSNLRRWRAAQESKCATDVSKAAAAWRRFVACMEALPPDQVAPLWQAAHAQAAAVCNVGSPKASPTCPAHLSIL